jgi:protein TonB
MSPSALLIPRSSELPEPPKNWGRAAVASCAVHLGLALLIALGFGLHGTPAATLAPVPSELVYVAEAGPAGGGGGSPAPASAAKTEIPRHRLPDPVPVTVAADVPKPDPDPVLDAPVTTNAATLLAMMGTSHIALAGPGGGGAPGTGAGPGTGPGLGPGSNGNTGGGPRQVGNGVTAPTLIRSRDPEYTGDAMRAKIQGIVELEVVVRPNGTVGEVRVTKSLSPDLDQQAVKAAKQWLFKPGTLAGSPIDVLVTLMIEFRIH